MGGGRPASKILQRRRRNAISEPADRKLNIRRGTRETGFRRERVCREDLGR